MAMTTLSTINAALSLRYAARLQTQINSQAVLAYLLPVAVGAGKSLNWTAEFSGASNAAASAEGVARSSSDADAEAEVPANLSWAQYDKTSSVTDMAAAAAASNENPESIGTAGRDLLLGRIITQGRRVALGVASDLYAGDPGASPAELAGAALAIASSGTFAGINPVTYPEWSAVEQTLATGALTLSALRSFHTAVYDACGYMPEFVTCDSTRFNLVRDLFSSYEANVVRELPLMRGGGLTGEEPRVAKLMAGMKAVDVDGVTYVMDKHATAGAFYSWNTEFVTIRQLDRYAGYLHQPEKIIDLFGELTGDSKLIPPREEIEGMAARGVGLRPSVKTLGDRGLSTEANVHLWAQVEWKRRNAFGKLTLV